MNGSRSMENGMFEFKEANIKQSIRQIIDVEIQYQKNMDEKF